MAQYYLLVNSARNEFVDPSRIGRGGVKFSAIFEGPTAKLAMYLLSFGTHSEFDEELYPRHYDGRWAHGFNRVVLAGDEDTETFFSELNLYKYAKQHYTDITEALVAEWNLVTMRYGGKYRIELDGER